MHSTSKAKNKIATLTFDIEDWYHANFVQLTGKEELVLSTRRNCTYNIEANIERWIEILAQFGATSTCFVLGEFARSYPNSVKKLILAGHEIVSHGNTHDLIYNMTREQFREFLKQGLCVLGDISGKSPIGFRAPSWSVGSATPWFWEELENQGVQYDSSIFPIKTSLFGEPNCSLAPLWMGNVLEIPATVLEFGKWRIPFASGAFFRLAPYVLIKYGLNSASKKDLPVMVVLHPRELDPGHPRLPLSGWEGVVHYARLNTTIPKLQRLLNVFQWKSIQQVYFGGE